MVKKLPSKAGKLRDGHYRGQGSTARYGVVRGLLIFPVCPKVILVPDLV